MVEPALQLITPLEFFLLRSEMTISRGKRTVSLRVHGVAHGAAVVGAVVVGDAVVGDAVVTGAAVVGDAVVGAAVVGAAVVGDAVVGATVVGDAHLVVTECCNVQFVNPPAHYRVPCIEVH